MNKLIVALLVCVGCSGDDTITVPTDAGQDATRKDAGSRDASKDVDIFELDANVEEDASFADVTSDVTFDVAEVSDDATGDAGIDSAVADAAIDVSVPDASIVDAGTDAAVVIDAGYGGIDYHHGPIMTGNPTIYLIWYGNWSNNTATTILPSFIQNLSGSPYLKINSTYYNAAGAHISGNITYGGSYAMVATKTALSESDIGTIVTATGGTDTNGIYIVLTAADITMGGFCTQYCGWHVYNPTTHIKYAFVGNSDTQCPGGCEQQGISPNNNAGADGMASVLAHEINESLTDPEVTFTTSGSGWWQDNSGMENADLCAWTFGTTYTVSNGSLANMKLGGLNYLIQRNWVNTNGGHCALQ